MSDRNSSIRRRNFLRATGVTTVSAVGIDTVSAKADSEYASVSFVEVGLSHRTSLPEVEGSFSFVHIDDVVEHDVDESEGEVRMDGTARESTKRTFDNNDHVSKFVGYQSMPTVIERRPTRVLTTNVGRAFRRTYGLTTALDYQRPPLDIRTRGKRSTDAIVVSSGDKKVEVDPGASESVHLRSRSVLAPVEKPTGEIVQNETIPEHKRAQRTETRLETVTVTPIVKVRNYGQLDVVETPR